MTEVWWCAIHDFAAWGGESSCEAHIDARPCEMVRMRLVPVDALVLTRGEDGNWPKWFRAFVKVWWIKAQRSDFEGRWPREFMDALEAAGKEEQ